MGTNNAEVENQNNPQTNTFTSDLPLSEVENQKNLQVKTFDPNPSLSLPNPEFDEEPEKALPIPIPKQDLWYPIQIFITIYMFKSFLRIIFFSIVSL